MDEDIVQTTKNIEPPENLPLETKTKEESSLKEFFEFLPMPVLILKSDNTIEEVNNALVALSGYDDPFMLGKDVSFLFGNKRKAMALMQALRECRNLQNKEMTIITKKKESVIVSVSSTLRLDSKGVRRGFFVAISDINELKNFQSKLEERVEVRTRKMETAQAKFTKTLKEAKNSKKRAEVAQEKTAAIISGLVDPVIVVDKERRLALVNEAAQKILKINKKDIGKKVGTITSRKSFTDFTRFTNVEFKSKIQDTDADKDVIIEEVIINPQISEKESSNPFLGGKRYYGEESIVYKVINAPVLGKYKKQYGYMKIFYNLTREKMVDQMKSEFVSIAAHQLRTPLSAIKWAIKYVLDGELGEINLEQESMLKKGYMGNERVIRIVNDMLNVSKIEQGRFGFSFRKGKLQRVVREAIENVEENIKKKKQKLEVHIPPGLPPIIMDRDKISIVVQNLIENAHKYTAEKGLVKISLNRSGNELLFRVKDSGVGIPESEKNKIFTKFFRAENVIRLQTEGSGLGLFIVKNIVDNHGGQIVCHSEEGVSSEFIVTLPINGKK